MQGPVRSEDDLLFIESNALELGGGPIAFSSEDRAALVSMMHQAPKAGIHRPEALVPTSAPDLLRLLVYLGEKLLLAHGLPCPRPMTEAFGVPRGDLNYRIIL